MVDQQDAQTSDVACLAENDNINKSQLFALADSLMMKEVSLESILNQSLTRLRSGLSQGKFYFSTISYQFIDTESNKFSIQLSRR